MTSTDSNSADTLVRVGAALEALKTDPDARKRVGQTIATMRKGSGQRVGELATAVALSRSYLYEIEAGRTPAHPSVYRRIADHFEVPLASLVDVDTRGDQQ